MGYTIIQDIIPNLPNFPYENGVGAYEGTALHCTDSPNHSGGDTPKNEANYEKGSFQNAFVHFFVGVENGAAVIRQTAPIQYGAYGAGHTANHKFVHIELCMYDDPKMFALAFEAYIWLSAKLLADKKLGVSDKGTVWSHKEISDTWHESTHQDPINYLAAHGISWADVINHIQARYNEFIAPPAPVSTGVRHVKIVNVSAACILMNKPDRDNSLNIGTIPLGTVVEMITPLIGVNNGTTGYYKVVYNGRTGYINAKYGEKC